MLFRCRNLLRRRNFLWFSFHKHFVSFFFCLFLVLRWRSPLSLSTLPTLDGRVCAFVVTKMAFWWWLPSSIALLCAWALECATIDDSHYSGGNNSIASRLLLLLFTVVAPGHRLWRHWLLVCAGDNRRLRANLSLSLSWKTKKKQNFLVFSSWCIAFIRWIAIYRGLCSLLLRVEWIEM